MRPPVIRVALTGGPGGGKSSLIREWAKLEFISGHHVVTLEETASRLKCESNSRGMAFKSSDIEFQRLVLAHQLAAENVALEECYALGVPAILLLDRVLFDSVGFIGKHGYTDILREISLAEQDVLRRYDVILFLRSAVIGGFELHPRFTIPNAKKFEAHVLKVESEIQQHISSHPRVVQIEAQVSFEQKMRIAHSKLESCVASNI